MYNYQFQNRLFVTFNSKHKQNQTFIKKYRSSLPFGSEYNNDLPPLDTHKDYPE